jgi:hypothetical protein
MWGVLGGAANAPNAAGNLQWISGSVLHPSYANGLLGNNMLHAGGRGSDARTLLSRLNPRIRTEVLHLLLAVPTLKVGARVLLHSVLYVCGQPMQHL